MVYVSNSKLRWDLPSDGRHERDRLIDGFFLTIDSFSVKKKQLHLLLLEITERIQLKWDYAFK